MHLNAKTTPCIWRGVQKSAMSSQSSLRTRISALYSPRTSANSLHRRQFSILPPIPQSFSRLSSPSPRSSSDGKRECSIERVRATVTATSISVPDLSRDPLGFEAVCAHPQGMRYFSAYLRRTHASENIEFDRFVERYKAAFRSGDRGKAHGIARYICRRFLSDEGRLSFGPDQKKPKNGKTLDLRTPVNIPGSTRKAVVFVISQNSPSALTVNLFDSAQRQILRLLRQGCFLRFKRSEEFRRYACSVKARQ